jgi:uncharacterized OB-fold protein
MGYRNCLLTGTEKGDKENTQGIRKRLVKTDYAFVRLDGADTDLQHYVEIKDEKKVKIGARVRAVFEEKRSGKITDIKHFVVID